MKTKLLAILALIGFSTLNPQLSTGYAQGTAFTYQGWLADGGNPAQGTYDLRFAICDSADGGSVVAGPITNSPVNIANGLFTTTLDFGAGVFDGNARWLEIAVRPSGAAADFTSSPSTALEVQGRPIKATGGLIIETRTSDPPSPVTGQIWLRTDL